MMNYDKLTKKELIYTLIVRDEMLKNCRERFKHHKTTDANTIQAQSDLIDVLNKALELACKELDNVEVFEAMFMECDSFYEYFLNKAKEMMKSEPR